MRKALATLVLGLAALCGSTMVQAGVRLYIPEDIDPPFYANLAADFTPNDNDWAVVIFYRSPECIPANFNLLDFLDFSGIAVSCPLQVHGSVLRSSPADFLPAQSFLQGNGEVPIWFVRWSDLQAMTVDGVLTIGELEAAPSLLVGTASLYHESVRNDNRGQRGGNSQVNAYGDLEDGRVFQVEFTEKFRDGVHTFPQIRIEFR